MFIYFIDLQIFGNFYFDYIIHRVLLSKWSNLFETHLDRVGSLEQLLVELLEVFVSGVDILFRPANLNNVALLRRIGEGNLNLQSNQNQNSQRSVQPVQSREKVGGRRT